MSIKSQGSGLYFIDSLTVPATPAIIKLKCPTGITGLGGPKDQIEDTCLEETEDKSFIAGLGTPGQVTVPFNLDPQHASHQILFDLKEAGNKIDWLIALSDGVAAPTLAVDVMTPPTDRTSALFTAYVADVNIDIATNTIVVGTLLLQRSGKVTWNWKA